ncbi:hypothetical protein F441_03448 [Phytophthora nicotianae CJ01A1]|uniref:WLGC domain-containing protein n=1 Tax=Phytophthora nicotianae CJ01A1 TaxID=1317063 RepID=W2XLY3_PHYNI|nr:hypothetical protein F441_03448 [Phytophthora nicotianae CJ01A1]
METNLVKANATRSQPMLRKAAPNIWQRLQEAWFKWRASQVIPIGPTVNDLPPYKKLIRRSSSNIQTLPRQSVVRIQLKYLSFRDAFGLLGLPMVVVALVCISWTVWLILLTIAPNKTANVLMNTGDYDDGQFWLIPEKLTALQVFSVVGLVVVAILYVYVLLKILVWRAHRHVEGTVLDRILQQCAPNREGQLADLELSHRVRRLVWGLYMFLKELAGFHGKYRKLWNLCLKVFDLTMQAFVLGKMLEEGIPVQLSVGFAGFIAVNSASCVVAILSGKHSAFSEILVDSLFDLGATVLLPILLLAYCSHTFYYDHDVFLIYMELMPIGSFERRARMFANPTEIELFRVCFDSLRIRSVLDLFLRIGMNLGFSYRFKRVVEVLIQIQMQPVNSSKSCQISVPRSLALLFAGFSIGVITVTHKSITTSQRICKSHPECVVYAYRLKHSEFCPCKALVNGNRAPKTYYEWTHPVDATDMVKALAAAGTLETLQLINRQLTVFPDELRGCHNLKYLSIVNCAIEELPIWAKEFHNLEFLQIEGKVGSDNLGNFETSLFSDMPELRYLQLGLHQRMTHLPPLDGAPNLCCLILARMNAITELPLLTRTSQLDRMEFTMMKHLAWIPDMEPIGSVVHFAVYQGAYLCCNGFLGTCDLTNPFCKDTTCLEDASQKATTETLQVFNMFSDGICQPYFGLSQTPTTTTIQMCDGVSFRQCQLPGLQANSIVVGMCYNHRMQVLACNTDPDTIQVRIRQIQKRVGTPCDPVEEAWLGCGGSPAITI